jgi:hypothetical protein
MQLEWAGSIVIQNIPLQVAQNVAWSCMGYIHVLHIISLCFVDFLAFLFINNIPTDVVEVKQGKKIWLLWS